MCNRRSGRSRQVERLRSVKRRHRLLQSNGVVPRKSVAPFPQGTNFVQYSGAVFNQNNVARVSQMLRKAAAMSCKQLLMFRKANGTALTSNVSFYQNRRRCLPQIGCAVPAIDGFRSAKRGSVQSKQCSACLAKVPQGCGVVQANTYVPQSNSTAPTSKRVLPKSVVPSPTK